MSSQRTVPPARAVGRAAAAAISAGLAAGFVADVTLYLLTTWLAGLAGSGLGMMGGVLVFIAPLAGIVTLLVPFTAGLIGGLVAGRAMAAIGSMVGVLAGLWTGSKLANSNSTLDFTTEGVAVVVAAIGVVTLIGHLTGSGLRQALRRR